MKTLKKETVKYDLLTEWEHGFHEGASIRRRGDKYYMVYTDISRGKATCMSYAVADHPLGPYKKGGVIIDNVYCDPSSWNNHGSIAEYKGQWYVFYHRSSQNHNTCRRVCVEKIEFDADGMIKEVFQTSCGAEDALDIRKAVPARAACRMIGKCRIELQENREILVVNSAGHWGNRDWAEYKHLDFGEIAANDFVVVAKGKGRIEVKIENNRSLCAIDIDSCDFEEKFIGIPAVSGIHTVWLFFEGEISLLDYNIR